MPAAAISRLMSRSLHGRWKDALGFGMEGLERCFHNVPDHVMRAVHICCGYPDYLDDEDYRKADPQSYHRLAGAMDALPIHQVSIEDAHCCNDLELLGLFQNKACHFRFCSGGEKPDRDGRRSRRADQGGAAAYRPRQACDRAGLRPWNADPRSCRGKAGRDVQGRGAGLTTLVGPAVAAGQALPRR